MSSKRLLITLLIIATLCTILLSSTEFLYQKASVIFERRLYAKILDLFQIEYSESTVLEVFENAFIIKQQGKIKYYLHTDDQVMVFKTGGPGLWSRIDVLIAINPGFQTLYGLKILEQGETPGLGGRIGEAKFQQQFAGKAINPKLELVKLAQQPNQVDAVSGATKTSNALEEIINLGIAELINSLKPDQEGDDNGQ